MSGFFGNLAPMADALIFVVGDFLLDRYIQGEATHICPEAPVPVIVEDNCWTTPGGSWNVALNVAAAGARVVSFTVDGATAGGVSDAVASETFQDGQSVIYRSPGRVTQIKTRILGQYGQQIVRLDTPKDGPITTFEASELVGLMLEAGKPDILVVSDYGCGVITPYFMNMLSAAFHGVRIVVDPYPTTDPAVYGRVYAMTPNQYEAARIEDALEPGENMSEFAEYMVITHRHDPVELVRGDEALKVAVPQRQLVDACGAGDAFVAHFATALAGGHEPVSALIPAVHAGAVAVSERGVKVVSREEVYQSLQSEIT